jgi:pimeloyl-ACP methyl ester carboxylesterase
MPYTESTERRIYYEVHGEGEPLVMVMGLGADTLAWIPQVPALSQRYRTIVFDNRDVGRSDYVDEPYEVADMADDALALCDELQLESFHLLGVSMGGAIAQHMALAQVERLRSLTLCVSWAGTGRYGAERGRVLGATAERMPIEQHVEMLLLLTMSEAFYENREAADYLRGVMLRNPNRQSPAAFARQAQASGRHDVRERIGTLSAPAHVIGAERDVLVPVWKSRELAELIPGAKLTVIDGAAHGVNLERAEEFNRAVLDFLATVPERAAA